MLKKLGKMEKAIWQVADVPQPQLNTIMGSHGLPRPIGLYLVSHGITAEKIKSYFDPSLKELSSPFDLPGMEAAAERLWKAVANKEKILIHGDYDVDGITSAVLLQNTLEANGALTDVFIPHRFDDGYGFTSSTLEKVISSTGCTLIVTVDCGISSFDAVDTAKSRNVDIIITDHHEPQGGVPAAFSVINPKVHPKLSSLHILSGAGVCFKLCQGFIEYGKKNKLGGGSFDIFDHLDIVSLGTVADIVPLVGENRILVKNGLNTLSKQSRPGIRALCEISGMNSSVIKTTDITFSLAPRLNAAGRLGDPYVAYKLLNSKSIIEAGNHSETLNNYNMERQNKEEIILNEAKKLIESSIDVTKRTIIISGENWHQGVIGIVATRLVKIYNRPVIVFSVTNGEALGSARGIPGFNLIEILKSCSGIVERYGGHPMAAGILIKTGNLGRFTEIFERMAEETATESVKSPSIRIDGEVEIKELDDEFFRYLEQLEPFGQSNSYPIFVLRNLNPTKLLPAAIAHSRGVLRDSNGNSISFIAFNRHTSTMPKSARWDVVATPSLNIYNNNVSKQLQIVDAIDA